MKTTKLFLAAILAVACAQMARADATIIITGSTAFRGAAMNHILNAYSAGVSYAYDGSSFTGSTHCIFVGSFPGISGTTTVKTSWSGSTEGVRDVAAGNNVLVLPNGTPTSTGGTSGASTAGLVNAVPKICFSDCYQSSSRYPSPVLNDVAVGVITFKFIANKGAPASLTNISDQQWKEMLAAGTVTLSQFTGNAADTQLILATGRYSGSGTRVNYLANVGYGVFNTVIQWKDTSDNGSAISALQIWPVGDGNNASVPDVAGNGGYNSGGTIKAVMQLTTASVQLKNATGGNIGSPQAVTVVTSLGLGDANTAIAGGAKELTFDGVLYSDAAVENGAFTDWSYEHAMNITPLSTDEQTFFTDLSNVSNYTPAALAGQGIALSAMNVSRAGDGGLVGP
jgi:hypothetical protein